METKCGSLEQPWRIVVPKGQIIELTLIDFMVGTRNATNFVGNVPRTCEVYATVKESHSQAQTVCGSIKKQSVVYTSSSNEVEIRLTSSTQSENQKHFLLKFKGTILTEKVPFC